MPLDAARWGPAASGPPRQLIILCHGLGADGQDLINLAPPWSVSLPHAAFAAPHAPELHDMGGPGRQWFSLADRAPGPLAAGAARARSALDAFIDAELERLKLPETAYAMMGFSQGAMMVLHTGLRRAVPPRAILAFSGALVAPGALAAERRNAAPVLLVHGEADDIVDCDLSHAAEQALRAERVPVRALYLPGIGHGIPPDAMTAGGTFLQQAFAGL